ncbi:hypothetical protein, partial [Flavonifractor plautii]|uniref:hypothetical protein n=1 Tax=Flavonifractor plautii TaxID=292800 RepID=UPI003D7E2863
EHPDRATELAALRMEGAEKNAQVNRKRVNEVVQKVATLEYTHLTAAPRSLTPEAALKDMQASFAGIATIQLNNTVP